MTTAKLRRIENTLRADIRWAITKGPGWHPMRGAQRSGGRWESLESPSCGVCAVGAHVVRHQPDVQGGDYRDVMAAAQSLGADSAWVYTLYYAVMDGPEAAEFRRERLWDNPADLRSAVRMGHRLRDYADEYKAKHAAKKGGAK